MLKVLLKYEALLLSTWAYISAGPSLWLEVWCTQGWRRFLVFAVFMAREKVPIILLRNCGENRFGDRCPSSLFITACKAYSMVYVGFLKPVLAYVRFAMASSFSCFLWDPLGNNFSTFIFYVHQWSAIHLHILSDHCVSRSIVAVNAAFHHLCPYTFNITVFHDFQKNMFIARLLVSHPLPRRLLDQTWVSSQPIWSSFFHETPPEVMWYRMNRCFGLPLFAYHGLRCSD